MNKTKRAFELANMKHQGQVRKDNSPYFQHPLRVMANIMQFKQSSHLDELLAAALLHDALEDTYTSYRELEEMFGPMVAGIVMECTTNDSVCKQMGKEDYLKEKMNAMSRYGLTVKLADRLDNVQDLGKFKHAKALSKVKETEGIMNHLLSVRTEEKMNTASIAMIREILRMTAEWKELHSGSQYTRIITEQTSDGS